MSLRSYWVRIHIHNLRLSESNVEMVYHHSLTLPSQMRELIDKAYAEHDEEDEEGLKKGAAAAHKELVRGSEGPALLCMGRTGLLWVNTKS